MTEETNTVFVGKKPAMSYVLALITQLNQGTNDVVIKARGKSISRAVDVAEIARNKFIKELKIENIEISTEEVTTTDGKNLKVSAIEIKLKK
ncbi:MAG TPA: DNA-binding protein Alba [archaeon]|nr:DNA-binding protein Alba [archaeon]